MALIIPKNLSVSFPEESSSKGSPLAYKLCIDLALDKCNGIDYDCSGGGTFVVPDGYVAFVKKGLTVCTDLILSSNIITNGPRWLPLFSKRYSKKALEAEGNPTRITYYLFSTQNREFRLKLDEQHELILVCRFEEESIKDVISALIDKIDNFSDCDAKEIKRDGDDFFIVAENSTTIDHAILEELKGKRSLIAEKLNESDCDIPIRLNDNPELFDNDSLLGVILTAGVLTIKKVEIEVVDEPLEEIKPTASSSATPGDVIILDIPPIDENSLSIQDIINNSTDLKRIRDSIGNGNYDMALRDLEHFTPSTNGEKCALYWLHIHANNGDRTFKLQNIAFRQTIVKLIEKNDKDKDIDRFLEKAPQKAKKEGLQYIYTILKEVALSKYEKEPVEERGSLGKADAWIKLFNLVIIDVVSEELDRWRILAKSYIDKIITYRSDNIEKKISVIKKLALCYVYGLTLTITDSKRRNERNNEINSILASLGGASFDITRRSEVPIPPPVYHDRAPLPGKVTDIGGSLFDEPNPRARVEPEGPNPSPSEHVEPRIKKTRIRYEDLHKRTRIRDSRGEDASGLSEGEVDRLTQSRFRDRYYTSLVFLILAFILSFTTIISVSYFSVISFVISVVGLVISTFTHPKILEQCYLNKRLPHWGKLVVFMILPIATLFIAFIVLLVNGRYEAVAGSDNSHVFSNIFVVYIATFIIMIAGGAYHSNSLGEMKRFDHCKPYAFYRVPVKAVSSLSLTLFISSEYVSGLLGRSIVSAILILLLFIGIYIGESLLIGFFGLFNRTDK